MKTAEYYWHEYSHESIVEGLREITESNFKQAIILCQQDATTLMDQIVYQNKTTKEDHDKIKKLEFELVQERSKVERAFIAGRSETSWEQFQEDEKAKLNN